MWRGDCTQIQEGFKRWRNCDVFYIQRAHKLQKALSDKDELLGFSSRCLCVLNATENHRNIWTTWLKLRSRTAETVTAQCSFSTSVHEPALKKSQVQIQTNSEGASPAVAASHRIYKVLRKKQFFQAFVYCKNNLVNPVGCCSSENKVFALNPRRKMKGKREIQICDIY